ncbi:DUF5719 family protein [Microbacterium sp.]|uniref:DUF5719 family protein n=1 Tax=Microbacterium sp. TaxID=51671 RepID=UPI003A88A8D6
MTVNWWHIGARAAARTVAVGVVVAAAAIAVVTPWPAVERTPISVTALPEPSTSLLACSGSLLALGREATEAAGLTAAAAQDVVVGTASGDIDTEPVLLDPVDVVDATGPATFVAEPVERVRTDIAAAGSSRVAAEDLSGFAASACTAPRLESWLVGGSGDTGAADLLLLANPGDVAAEVEVSVFGGAGRTEPEAGAGIVVPAGTQRAIPLAALGIDESSPSIRVTATGAPVSATLQTSIVRTLVPGGVDVVGATAPPALTQVIPGVTVTRASGQAGASNATTVVRVLAPSEAAEATIVVRQARGAGRVVDSRTVSLAAAVPLQLEVDGLPLGSYTVRVEATAPVVAAVWEATGFGEGSDFAWYTAAEPLTVPSLAVIAPGPSPTLAITNDGADDAVVKVIAEAGTGRVTEVTVRAGAATGIRMRGGAAYALSTDASEVRAVVGYSASGALAGYPVSPADAAAPAVRVLVQ